MTAANRVQIAAVLAQLAQALADDEPEPQVSEPRPVPSRVLLTMEEAAEQLGIGRTTAYRLAQTGELQTVQIGRLRRVHTDEVAAYAARLVSEQNAA
jgi:excisionase family DNA binding protein